MKTAFYTLYRVYAFTLETTVHPISRESTTYCSGLSVESAGLPVVIVSLASCLHFIRLF